ncbi:MAG: hypothetical protein F6K58_16120 [Symploca sp. SIO2E9]|nr:hypothetical protein [Symploca sp. SIO2E9]
MDPSNIRTTVEIHEFSTGIKAEITTDGGWISTGFTGRYMNVTLPNERIPYAVERAIANKLFAVVEGASSNQPAVIGRVVLGEPDWSVVAVVSRGRDDGGRPLSVYRYFLCQGADSLWKILMWMEQYAEQREGQLPVFNPFDTRVSPLEDISRPPEIPSEKLEQEFGNESVPIVLSREYQYNFRLINKIAEIKAGGQPVSWAYNAEALENPWSFVVIDPASERAYISFQQAQANLPLTLMPAAIDKQALKSAIKSLINSSQVKPEAVEVITESLRDEQITVDYWETLFNDEGASKALNQNLYSPQLVRLITLRALVIPETLPEFLAWLNIKGGRQKPDNNQVISLEFQEALGSQLPQEQLARGIKLILPELLERQITPEAVHWLLKAPKSAWKHCRGEFINNFLIDLEMIGSFQQSSHQSSSSSESNSFRCGDKIWNKLLHYLQVVRYRRRHSEPYYRPLANLFEWLEEYRLSAYFYQVGCSKVPREIFIQAFSSSSSEHLVLSGLHLRKNLTLPEKIIKQSSGILKYLLENRGIFCIIIGLSLLSGTITYVWIEITKEIAKEEDAQISSSHKTGIGSSNNDSENQETTSGIGSVSKNETPAKETPNPIYKMPPNQKKKALRNFNATSESIQKIVEDLVNDNELNPKLLKNKKKLQQQPGQPHEPEVQVVIGIKTILKYQNLNYAGAIEGKAEPKSIKYLKGEWVEAIYTYQKDKGLESDGIINYRPGEFQLTYEKLKTDTKQHLENL